MIKKFTRPLTIITLVGVLFSITVLSASLLNKSVNKLRGQLLKISLKMVVLRHYEMWLKNVMSKLTQQLA